MNTDQLKEKTEDLQETAVKASRKVKDKAYQWQQTAKENATNVARVTDDYVRDNPWGAIGIAAVFALALGILIGGRRD
jgi:ElaB/YqjD/DUF883 family membrane-anchored ribosome-binding protein